MITTPEDIKRLGTILGVWAHPDDESFTCGGLLAAAVQSGQRVVCITATKGEAGESKYPADQLGDIRAAELQKALKILGVLEHHWLDYLDGHCRDIETTAAVGKISQIISGVQPDTILTFGPDGLTGHPDHAAVSMWTDRAVEKLSQPPDIFHVVTDEECYGHYLKPVDEKINIFFNIDEPVLRGPEQSDIYLKLSDELMRKKYMALKAMESQTESLFQNFDVDAIANAFGIEAFVKAN